MTNLKRWAWAAAVGAAFTGPAFAQTTGTTTTTTGGTTTGGGGQASPQSTIEIVQIETPTITSTTATGSGQGANVAASNAFGPYFANPAWQGRAGTNTGSVTTVVAPGGFGQVLYSTTGTGGTGATNRVGTTGATTTGGRTGTTTGGLGGTTTTGGRTTTTGGLGGTTTGGLGGTTGGRTTGGFGGAGTQQNTTNQQLSTGRAVAYTQTIRFAAPPAPQGPQLTSDLQSMIASSSSLSSVAGLQVTAGDGGAVVLRGAVADADEKRLVEGMIRLTPGVKAVQNELTIK